MSKMKRNASWRTTRSGKRQHPSCMTWSSHTTWHGLLWPVNGCLSEQCKLGVCMTRIRELLAKATTQCQWIRQARAPDRHTHQRRRGQLCAISRHWHSRERTGYAWRAKDQNVHYTKDMSWRRSEQGTLPTSSTWYFRNKDTGWWCSRVWSYTISNNRNVWTHLEIERSSNGRLWLSLESPSRQKESSAECRVW